MRTVVAEQVVQEAIRLRLIDPADADRFRDPVLAPPERPFDGAAWTQGRRLRYAIASAASGCTATLPPPPVPPPSGRRVAGNPPKRRKRKLKGV
jgi:hypothetical protein